MNEEGERFKYNMDLEHAMSNLLGNRYYGSAGAFRSYRISKEFLRRAIRKIKRRLNEIITTDDRLILTTSITLNRLDNYVKKTSEKVNNDWLIISNLLNLVSLLLGYDWEDGKVHRHVFFYQNKQQERDDYQKRFAEKFWDEFMGDWRIRFEIVYVLKQKKLSNNQIAGVLRISDKLVAKILQRINNFEKGTGKEFLQHSSKLDRIFFNV